MINFSYGFKLTAKTSVPPSGTRILLTLPKAEISQDNRLINPGCSYGGGGVANLVLVTGRYGFIVERFRRTMAVGETVLWT